MPLTISYRYNNITTNIRYNEYKHITRVLRSFDKRHESFKDYTINVNIANTQMCSLLGYFPYCRLST